MASDVVCVRPALTMLCNPWS